MPTGQRASTTTLHLESYGHFCVLDRFRTILSHCDTHFVSQEVIIYIIQKSLTEMEVWILQFHFQDLKIHARLFNIYGFAPIFGAHYTHVIGTSYVGTEAVYVHFGASNRQESVEGGE